MPSLSHSVLILAGLLGSLLMLAWLSRQISIYIQLPVYLLTHSPDAPTVVLFLIFLPGVIIHEAAHWSMARLLGLKTGKFRVWPKRQGKHIGLGSVSVQSGGPLVDSLVGLAPLLTGSILIGWIGHQIFNAQDVSTSLLRGQWISSGRAFWLALREPDGVLWAYLLFAIANAMMPSASDREPVKPVILYAALAVTFYFTLGLPIQPVTALMERLLPSLQTLINAFVFTIMLDIAALAVLYLLRLFLRPS